MKKILTIGTIIILLLLSQNSIAYRNNIEPTTNQIKDNPFEKIITNNNIYIPKNITPENVSYHQAEKKFNIEWWYFEGIFNNGYNAVVNIILYSKQNIGLCLTHLNIFHINNTNDFFSKREIQSLKTFHGSKLFPDISINGKQIINFNEEKYNISKKWIYNISLEMDNNLVDLEFIGLTPGWEGNTLGGYYGPVLPMANVKGKIKINDKTINVTGIGYHEHAHNISFPIKEWGWYWGKIVGENTSLFWGKMMNTRWNEQARAGVFSIINSTYINIKPENIKMKLQEYKFYNKRFIPTKFIFNISSDENNIFININMTTISVHYLPLGLFHYWRYLIKINGEIIYNNNREIIKDKTQIMELMRFR